MVTIDLALAGIALGAVAALVGLGVLVTYQTTGVFNLAVGGVAMIVAYVLWFLVRSWGWPVAIAGPLAILVVGPAIGYAAEIGIFRPLRRRNASSAETLVASMGLLVLLIGAAYEVWGLQAHLDAPSLVPSGAVDLPGGATIDRTSLAQLAAVLVLVLILLLGSRYTRYGLVVRAVVDSRFLARRCGISADKVAAFGWMAGCGLAGLGGVLLAPASQLDPYSLTLVVLETLAVVVIGRLVSPVWTVVAALAIGVGQAELQQVQFTGRAQTLLGSLQSNLFVVALLLSLLLLPKLAETSTRTTLTALRRPVSWPRWSAPIAAVILLIPLVLGAGHLHTAQQVPALALIFLSLVLLSGVAGQVSLGTAGFAGAGAVFAASLSDDQVGLANLPTGFALFCGVIVAAAIGLVTGYPALRRAGLSLALTTFAVGTVLSRFVFEQPGLVSGLHIRRVVNSDRGFYAVELVLFAIGLLAVVTLTSGPVGRALRAARDSPEGAQAAGVDVRRLTLVAFTVSAGIAGLGGALLVQSAGAFDAEAFDPLHGLLWFTAVAVAGADSAFAAVVLAGLITLIDALAGTGAALFAVGAAAVLLGRFPGGVAGLLRADAVLRVLPRSWRHRHPGGHGLDLRRPAPVSAGGATLQLSAAGRRLFGARPGQAPPPARPDGELTQTGAR